MEEYLRQLRIAAETGLYYISLVSSLTLIDICGALSSDDGQANKNNFREWFDKYISHKYTVRGECLFSGEDCYQFRCSMLHEATTILKKSKYNRIFFLASKSIQGHNNVFAINNEAFLNLDIKIFSEDVIEGVSKFLKEESNTVRYKANYDKFIKLYLDGFPPLTKGVPTIT